MEAVWYPIAKELGKEFDILRKVGAPVMIEGEAGTSKTFFCQSYAMGRGMVMGKTLFTANMTPDTDVKELIGYKDVMVGVDGTKFEWIDGALTRSITAGGMFIADELNRGDGTVLNRLFSVLETGSRHLSLYERGGQIVPIPEKWFFMATQNPAGGMYYTKPLDKALAERFVSFKITEPLCDEGKLAEIMLPKKTYNGTGESFFNIAKDSRKKPTIPMHMSTRSLTQCMRLVSAGMPPLQALNLAWVNKLDDEETQLAAVAVISTYFTKELEKKSFKRQVKF